jgi:hypothetical protein
MEAIFYNKKLLLLNLYERFVDSLSYMVFHVLFVIFID